MGEHEVFQLIDTILIQLPADFSRCVDQKVLIMDENSRPCPGVGDPFFPSFPADAALAEGLS